MYRAYDRYLYERPTDASASATTSPLGPEHLDSRVVSLLYCPPLPRGTRFVLVRRDWPGTRNVLSVGRAMSAHESSNLAAVRLRAARLGANEVHVLPALNN